ncbi:MAG: DNA helicase PriA [Methanobacteriales archaeon HGW-Methanobacteriales-1]|jgi:predicted Zn-ribbon and HTH transcriptional regulator|nr:MAG: DNA helicase PriA [Methanobacteriales archaeon HGW-Methanobacteriales-1]
MRCKICSHSFDEKIKSETCAGCPSCNCRKIKCPNCGYENLPEINYPSKLMKFFKTKLKLKVS